MALIAQSELARPGHSGADWHGAVLADLAQRLTPPSDFPCTFSQNAFRRELTRFIFVESDTPADRAATRADLSAYIAEARGWDGQVNTARPLVIAFSPAAVPPGDLASYHAFGWRILQDLACQQRTAGEGKHSFIAGFRFPDCNDLLQCVFHAGGGKDGHRPVFLGKSRSSAKGNHQCKGACVHKKLPSHGVKARWQGKPEAG